MTQKVLLKSLCFKFGCILETNQNINLARTQRKIIQVHPDIYELGLVGLFIVLHEIAHNVLQHSSNNVRNEFQADEFAYDFLCANFSVDVAQKAIFEFVMKYENHLTQDRVDWLLHYIK